MMRLEVCLLGSLLAACGGNKDSEENNDSASSLSGVSGMNADKLGGIDQFVGKNHAPPVLDTSEILLPTMAKLQPKRRAMAIEFRGFTEDESQYVLKVTRATAWPHMDAGPATYELIQVHDTLTGMLMQSFRNAIEGELPKKGDKDVALWKQARPKSRWQRWERSHPLSAIQSKARFGDWEITATPRRESLEGKNRLSIETKPDKFVYTWTIVKSIKNAKSPQIEFRWKNHLTLSSLLVFRLPFQVRDFFQEFEGEVSARGEIHIHFSPSGDRVLFVINSHLMVDNEAFPSPAAMSYMRSLGPQIKIKDSSNTKQARALAQALADKNLPITIVENSDEPIEFSTLYYRNISQEARSKLKETIPGLREEKLQKEGWLDAILILSPSI